MPLQEDTSMSRSWNGDRNAHLARAAFYLGEPPRAAELPRDLRIAAIIEKAPRFPMEEVTDELLLKLQGGLRGYVSETELN